MTRLAVRGIELNVEFSEKRGIGAVRRSVQSRGNETTMLLLHGFTGSTATWQSHLDGLTENARVVAVDLIGHGRSDAPPDVARYSFDHCVADLREVLDRLRIARATVVGYSLGARVALHLALHCPERVERLVLESGSPGLSDPAERAARRRDDDTLAEALERDGVERFVAYWEALPLFATQRRLAPAVRERLHAQRLRNSARGLANSLRGMGTGAQESLWERLDEIDIPTSLVTGALDAKFCALGRAMVEYMPRAQLTIVPGAGHAVHLEQPNEFAELVRAEEMAQCR